MKKLETRKGLRNFWTNIGRAEAIKEILEMVNIAFVEIYYCDICQSAHPTKVCSNHQKLFIFCSDLKSKIKEMEKQ